MSEEFESTRPEFWNTRYAAGKTPWDFGGIPTALKWFLAKSSQPTTVLIPGCGSGYEIQAFHDAGYDVTAIDFSPAALEQAKTVLGPLAQKIVLGDFFSYEFEPRRFDLIYERTFLCSLPPSCWTDYARRVSELLAHDGRLVGIFLYGQEPEPPPYPLAEEQANRLFGKFFRLRDRAPVLDSLPIFRGMERWQEWVRIQ